MPLFKEFPEVVEDKRKPELPAQERKVETPRKMPVRKVKVLNEGPSIREALSGKLNQDKISAKEQHEIYTRSGEITEFTVDELLGKWNLFLSGLNDRPNLQSTLTGPPRMIDNYQLILEIDNSVQDDLINSIKPELVSWLRRELKNSDIQLITKISETAKENIIYSDSDKYAEMLKKNPYLDLLKQKFKLDFE